MGLLASRNPDIVSALPTGTGTVFSINNVTTNSAIVEHYNSAPAPEGMMQTLPPSHQLATPRPLWCSPPEPRVTYLGGGTVEASKSTMLRHFQQYIPRAVWT